MSIELKQFLKTFRSQKNSEITRDKLIYANIKPILRICNDKDKTNNHFNITCGNL